MKIRSGRLAIIGMALALLVSACSGGAGGSAAPKGTVNIAVNPWVGYTADAAVVAYILQNKMGYTVVQKDLKEDVSWQGFDSGEVDVILENWGHPDLEKTYITDKKVAMDAGQTGNVGIIGWYVPKWYADANPDVVADFHNLNNHVADFKTVESGDKGQFLGTDPSYVQYDEALIKNFGLNFTVKFSGSENATIEAIKTAVNQKKPLLFYWWDPQWLNSKVDLVRIPLPAYTAGCDADKEKVACDYPETPLNKIIRVAFNNDGGAAAQFIKNFKWTNADQNEVAAYITNDNMKPEDAAKKWVDAHESTWQAWIPK
jgi:glycine betaine/proline transport system substrate-binding protein